MIPKSVQRFSDKIMRKRKKAGARVREQAPTAPTSPPGA
jgi:hypothetical protein